MKKLTALLTVLMLATGSTLMCQTLDEVLSEHFAAIGQENQLKVNSARMTGKMMQSGIEIPFVQMMKRPKKVRVEATFQDLTLVQTFNGEEGWSVNPFAGVTEPQPMSADEVKSMNYTADMDGMLWDHANKGYTVSLEGSEDMEGTMCHVVKLVTDTGDTFTFYIDSDSYIILRTNNKVTVMGNETETDTYQSNYSMVDGIAVPGKIETRMQGQVMMTLLVDKAEFNPELDDALFEKPVNQ
mgnify:CR=1 FL=1